MTRIIYTVGNCSWVRELPWLDALAFYFQAQSVFLNLMEWPIKHDVDREDASDFTLSMRYGKTENGIYISGAERQ